MIFPHSVFYFSIYMFFGAIDGRVSFVSDARRSCFLKGNHPLAGSWTTTEVVMLHATIIRSFISFCLLLCPLFVHLLHPTFKIPLVFTWFFLTNQWRIIVISSFLIIFNYEDYVVNILTHAVCKLCTWVINSGPVLDRLPEVRQYIKIFRLRKHLWHRPSYNKFKECNTERTIPRSNLKFKGFCYFALNKIFHHLYEFVMLCAVCKNAYHFIICILNFN